MSPWLESLFKTKSSNHLIFYTTLEKWNVKVCIKADKWYFDKKKKWHQTRQLMQFKYVINAVQFMVNEYNKMPQLINDPSNT